MRSDSPSEHQPQVHQHQHLRIQLHPEREPHHKRQRSPPAQITTFESLIPSPSTQAANNMERLKRARHRISTAPETAMGSSMEHPGGDQQMSWRDRTDQGQHSQQDKRDEMALHPLNRHRDSDETHMQHSIQHRQHPTRIHPFDSEPTTATPSETANAPIIPKMAPVSRVEPSIHPLDTREPSSSTVLKEHRFGAKDVTPSSTTTSRELAAPQQGSDVQSSSAVRVEKEATSRLIESQRKGKSQDSTIKDAAKDVVSTRPPPSATSTKATPAPTPAPTLAPVPAPAPEVPTSTAVTLNLPITRETLHELDMPEVFKNAQLRHDIVFDPHLQFRPNFDGERGLVKKREADRFWREVGLELNNRRLVLAARREAAATMLSLAGLSSSSPTSRLIQQQAQQMCPLPKAVLLPRLIDELREILLSLLPANQAAAPGGHQAGDASQVNPERALLISTLDPDLILQELDHGVLNVHALFRFLGDSLKGHCAPMRDALVETMVSAVVDLDEIVRGIRMCFEILEYMKLDIANHQLRIMRPWLLDKSIDFEQQYFAALLTRGGTINRTASWLKRSWIQWESVKRSVIDQPSSANDIPSDAGASSRRASLALTAGPSDAEQTGGHPKAFFNPKRRSSIIRTEIGENILDGVVNEGLLDMILRPHEAVHTMPETFELDHYRMLSFHNDFQDLTILCMLLILFRQLAQNCWTQQDLVEIKKVVWLLLTDENANFGANTNLGPATAAAAAAAGSAAGKEGADAGISNGMKDIVVQIEFAARKVRERSKNSTASASTSSNTTATSALSTPASSAALPPAAAAAARAVPSTGLSASETNLLTAWLNNALNKTSTLYVLIQKRLLIHFRRWLYLHSCSSMMVLSASCASLASAMSLSSASSSSSLPSSAASAADGDETDNEDEEDAGQSKGPVSSAQEATESGVSKDGVEAGRDLDQESANGNGKSIGNVQAPSSNKGAVQAQGQDQRRPQRPQNQQQQQPPSKSSASGSPDAATVTSAELSPEEANKAAAEALAAKLSFNATEMEAHGLTGLEDEMIALLEKIRALSEFNKKVYGSWYRDLVKQGRAENWLDVTMTTTATTMTSV
ncbi:hypothetical protein BGZ98_008019 [Dissophora globulifera]|nr:hypothetical protein BGZ98_008019 [Dissophora globulifera]